MKGYIIRKNTINIEICIEELRIILPLPMNIAEIKFLYTLSVKFNLYLL